MISAEQSQPCVVYIGIKICKVNILLHAIFCLLNSGVQANCDFGDGIWNMKTLTVVGVESAAPIRIYHIDYEWPSK